jgi:hypothetical protein
MIIEKSKEDFEEAIKVSGMYVNLNKIGPDSQFAGDYNNIVVQTCWSVWQMAIDYCNKKQEENTCI